LRKYCKENKQGDMIGIVQDAFGKDGQRSPVPSEMGIEISGKEESATLRTKDRTFLAEGTGNTKTLEHK
jgi:hypothetical protein